MMEVRGIALAIYLAELLLLLPRLPLWLFILSLLSLFARALASYLGLGTPPRILLFILGIMAISLALTDTPSFWHKETATATILIVALLLLWDRPSPRQLMLLHSSFFGALVALLVTAGAQLSLFIYFGLTLLIFISLMLHHLPSSATITLGQLSRKLVKTAVPVAAVMLPLYFLFPEIKPNPADRAVTGLSDSIEPGKIASLARSERVAFRARFAEKLPRAASLYWRVSVLEEGAGMRWQRGRVGMDEALRPSAGPAPFNYEIMTEPRLGSAIPLLEHTLFARPAQKTELGIFWDSSQRSYRSAHAILQVGSDLSASFKPAREPEPSALRTKSSARVEALAASLEGLSLDKKIETLLALFQNSFGYTLEPGRLNQEDSLDEFLFETRRGYCEHFAAAFASLMQLTGTPVRIVTGFSGGTSLGDSRFYLVSDGDAHAWTEVWTGSEWRRVDPSAVVPGRAPVRDQLSLRLQTWSALPLAWLDYGRRQLGIKLRELTQDIALVWLIVFSLAAVLLLLQLLRFVRRRDKEKLWERELARLESRLLRRGLKRQLGETMPHFLGRVAETLPAQRKELMEAGRLYNEEMFGPDQGKAVEKAKAAAFQRRLSDLRRAL